MIREIVRGKILLFCVLAVMLELILIENIGRSSILRFKENEEFMNECLECGREGEKFTVFTGHMEILEDGEWVFHGRTAYFCEDHYPEIIPGVKYQPRDCRRVRICWLHD